MQLECGEGQSDSNSRGLYIKNTPYPRGISLCHFGKKIFYRKGGICQRKKWKKGLKREKIKVEGRISTRKYFSKISGYREDFWQKKGYNKPCVITGDKLPLSEGVWSMGVTLFPDTN
jgi:hypothetical protein